MTISTTKSRAKDISFIIEKLRPHFKAIKGIMVCEEIDGREKLGLAVFEDKKDLALSYIFDAVSEAIIRDYKEEYFTKNLKINSANKLDVATFIKTLVMFDKASDKDIIKSHLKPSDEILIDSLYNFRLWELNNRWQDICSLVTENSGYLLMSGSFLDLMRFLIMTSETEMSEVHVHYGNGNIFAQSAEGKEVFNLKYTEDDDSKINVLSELIGLAPEKIVLYNDINDRELSSYIVSLFDGKVSVLK